MTMIIIAQLPGFVIMFFIENLGVSKFGWEQCVIVGICSSSLEYELFAQKRSWM